ncbi:MAG: C-terminal binding protein [Thermomicrobiales bacterium]|nr:C-terminal binding protein [Thermomicrobiales bacterium]
MTHSPHVLVSTSDRYDFDWEHDTLSRIPGFAFELRRGSATSQDEMLEIARGADALLVSSREAITRPVIEQLDRLKVIARYAVGLDHIDLDAAADHGIVVTHYPMYCTNEVADHALALLLALNRRIVQFDRDLRQGAWVTHTHHMDRMLAGPIPPLREMTVGIIGIGRIGSAVAARLAPFGVHLLAYDPYLSADEVRAAGAEAVSFEEVLQRADIVTLHCPLTPETRGLIDAAALASMKPSAMLVNTARGPIVDLDAIALALDGGKLGGAALDVVYPEPLPLDSPLYALPNVILTPHAAYYSERSVQVIRTETLMAAVDVLQGRQPKVVANPAVLPRVTLAPAR